MTRPVFLFVLSFVLFPFSGASGQDAPKPEEGYHQHDGFFLRLATGWGVHAANASVSNSDPVKPYEPISGEVAISGQGGFTEVAIGGVVTDNLALHADLFMFGTDEAKTRHDWQWLMHEKAQSGGGIGLGIGATYYFMPINIYVSAALGVGVYGIVEKEGSLDLPGEETVDQYLEYTDRKLELGAGGSAFNFMVGKEWWLSSNWALGLALQGTFIKAREMPTANDGAVTESLGLGLTDDPVPLEDTKAKDLGVFGVALLISATYN